MTRKKGAAALLLAGTLLLVLLAGCAAQKSDPLARRAGLGNGSSPEGSMQLHYAQNFAVDTYSGGLSLITLADGSRFLVVPAGGAVPAGIDTDIVVLQQPLTDVYLVATSAMSLFDAVGGLDAITLAGTRADGWYTAAARTAMDAGKIRYAGKYNEPDYELIVSSGCRLAVESTMISHAPDVKEKLETLGVPVFVDQSSQEEHPLGRTEWVRLYGVLLGREAEAGAVFDAQLAYMDALAGLPDTGKTVAFFYINSAGAAVARRSGDYITKMIELAGGRYIFDSLGDPDSKTSTVTLEMEQFYATAKDADYIIYNSTIDGGVRTLEELMAKNELMADFKAVQDGNVWCTEQDLFQETTRFGLMISNIHDMLTSPAGLTELDFMYKLE